MKKTQAPSTFTPNAPAEFIGGAGKVGNILAAKARRIADGSGTLKALLYGPPGVGKTACARMIATIAGGGSKWNIESINGRSVNIDLVREWQRQSHYTSIYGGCTVKLVDELDTCPAAAQDLLLTFLDGMRPGWVFIGTSNLDIAQLTPRLQTRLQTFKVEAPGTNDLVRFLKGFCPAIRDTIASQIAVGSGGNVRAALLDLETHLDAQSA